MLRLLFVALLAMLCGPATAAAAVECGDPAGPAHHVIAVGVPCSNALAFASTVAERGATRSRTIGLPGWCADRARVRRVAAGYDVRAARMAEGDPLPVHGRGRTGRRRTGRRRTGRRDIAGDELALASAPRRASRLPEHDRGEVVPRVQPPPVERRANPVKRAVDRLEDDRFAARRRPRRCRLANAPVVPGIVSPASGVAAPGAVKGSRDGSAVRCGGSAIGGSRPPNPLSPPERLDNGQRRPSRGLERCAGTPWLGERLADGLEHALGLEGLDDEVLARRP